MTALPKSSANTPPPIREPKVDLPYVRSFGYQEKIIGKVIVDKMPRTRRGKVVVTCSKCGVVSVQTTANFGVTRADDHLMTHL